MRYGLLICLTLVIGAQTVRGEKPIPQDLAQIKKFRRDRADWFRRTIEGPYIKLSKHDARWDKLGRKAIDLLVRNTVGQTDPEVTGDEVFRAVKAAVDAGCDDPYVAYIFSRLVIGEKEFNDEQQTRLRREATKAFGASKYPAFRRAFAYGRAGDSATQSTVLTDELRKEAEVDYEAVLALLPESVATDERNEFWEDTWFRNLTSVIAGYRKLGLEPTAAFAKVDSALAKLPKLKVLRLVLHGSFWVHYGWEARTDALAPQVPEGAWKVFHERLVNARQALEEAWRLRPNEARTANLILQIEKGIGGDRETMELWFDRAMKANGDNYGACITKLDWLDPKWHGNAEEMLAFGRACAATKNWWANLTILNGEAHRRYWWYLDDAEGLKYMQKEEVWAEIKPVYEEFLKHYPSNDVVRSKYAATCVLGSHYVDADKQFEILGDRLTIWTDQPTFKPDTLDYFREKTRFYFGKSKWDKERPAKKAVAGKR